MLANRIRTSFFILFSSSLVFAHPGHPEDEAFFPVIFNCLLSLAITLGQNAIVESIRKCTGPDWE